MKMKDKIAPLIQGVAVTLFLFAGALGLVAYVTLDHWWPGASAGAHDDEHDHEADAHAHEENVLEVSREGQQSMGLDVQPLERTRYEQVIPVPGVVRIIPGVSRQEVTAKASGEITRIYFRDGELVAPGEPLFDLSLTHEEAIERQIELLDALAALEKTDAEIERLEGIERQAPGGVAGSRLLNERYERRHQVHRVESRRQLLVLLGLPREEVDRLIESHRARPAGPSVSPEHETELIDRLTVRAPTAGEMTMRDEPPASWVAEQLFVHLGQHVDVGIPLCRLADFRRLYVEGQAFERNLAAVRRAAENGWSVTVVSEQMDGAADTMTGPIVYIDSTIDETTRAARFYVALENTLTPRPHPGDDRRAYADWRFRPGQRLEVRVPVALFEERLVVPLEAIASDGLERYVFHVSDTTIVRRPVEIEHQDDRFAVLAEGQVVSEGTPLAMSAAYQLQLSLKNRQSGPVEHSHGGAGHSH